MKALYEITDSRDLERQRALLLRQLHAQQRRVDGDMQRIHKSWTLWRTIGSSVSGIAGLFLPKLNMFSVGFSIARRLLRRKK